LFAFDVTDPRLAGLAGVSVQNARVAAAKPKLDSAGPVLITHSGLSGPAILRLSAWGARALHDLGYRFEITIAWVPGEDVRAAIADARAARGKRRVHGGAPVENFPRRLWQSLCSAAGIAETRTWAQLEKQSAERLALELEAGRYHVAGKSINKDEFVTCGGVRLPEVDMRTMESKILPGLHFAGEILDIDGITGGFNFQNAWTTGFLAGSAAANAASRGFPAASRPQQL